MDKSKIIAVVVLIGIGGALLYTKSQSPDVPGAGDAEPQSTAIADAAPDESSNAITNAASAEVADNSASTDANATDANAATSNAIDANATDANAATSNATGAGSTGAQADATELKIVDERVGTGPVAQSGDQLSMNYKGTLTNGKVFDQSYGREPFNFQLGGGQVIQGWDKGIVGMKVGGKRKLVIPPNLGYGDQGAGADIPPGATLVFEVELLSVNDKTS